MFKFLESRREDEILNWFVTNIWCSEEQRVYQQIKQEPVEQARHIPSVTLLTFLLQSAEFQCIWRIEE
jgi:hypothetical protein